MNGTFFYIGLGLGLAAACGLRPFLPLLLAGALASAGALGVEFGPAGHAFHFLQAGWWLLAVTVVLVLAYVLQILLERPPVAVVDRRERGDPFAAALTGLAFGAGALLFGGTLAAHGDTPWPGLLGGLAAVGLAQRASAPVLVRARARLPDRAAREALTIYLDSAALLLAALVALLHPLGYVAIALLAWFVWRGRSRGGDDRYAGLRILRR
jgi:Domain of unknown function (DUF4126)